MPKKKTKKKGFFKRFSKKKLAKLGIMLVAATIIIIIASYFINVNIKLLFDTETHITLSPTISSITIPDKTSPKIPFTTTIEKLSACDIICTYELIDVTNNLTINKTVLKTEKETSMTYSLPIRGIGEGQSAFNYVVTCKTTNRTFCPSKGKQYEQTAFVTVNYGLTKEESNRKEKLKKTLPRQATLLANTHSNLQETITLINTLNNYVDLNEEAFRAALLEKKLTDIDNQERNIIETWEEEYYQEAELLAKEQERIINDTAEQVDTLAQEINSAHLTYEEAANNTRKIYERRNMITGWTGFLSQTNSTIYDELKNTSDTYNNISLSRLSPTKLLEETKQLLNNTQRSEIAYVKAKATQKAAQQQIKATYEPLLQAMNQTWNEENCSFYESLTNTFNTTNSSIIIIVDYLDTYCPEEPNEQLFNEQPLQSIINNNTISLNATSIPEPTPHCCYQGTCKPCDTNPYTPIILIHGHSFSKSTSPELAFARLGYLQTTLSKEGYLHASTINAQANINNIPTGDWGKLPAPIVISTTYYYLNYYELGQLSFTTRKTESIESYAIRLKEAIETVKEKTGSKEVVLIAHSMGGLVAREYLYLFGDSDVKTLITIGTPNHGVEGEIKRYCTITGAQQECEEMAVDSPFLKILNNPRNNPTHTNIYTIRGIGCPTDTDEGKSAPGDGVVLAESVMLDFAKENYEVKGTCTDLLKTSLHMDIINTELYPQTYEYIKEILAMS